MKRVLDMCCGARRFYADQADSRVLACDIRQEDLTEKIGRPCNVSPDEIQDFRNLPAEWTGRFDLVIFDPPHFTQAGEKSYMRAKYGVLNKETWKEDLAAGFKEGFRVLRSGGTLIFKWNETHVRLCEVLKLTSVKPLILNKKPTQSKTHWIVFYKEAA